MAAARIRFPAWLVGAALFLAAAAARLWLRDAALYGDETAHYHVARHFGAEPANVVPASPDMAFLWWQRPLFSLLLAPWAQGGFDAYRLGHLLMASLLPVAAWLLARRSGARPWLAIACGLALALHPDVVLWSVRVFPDALMAAAALAALAVRRGGDPVRGYALLAAAAWLKESAVVLLAGVLAWDLFRGARAGRTRLWPLALDKPQTAGLAAAAAAVAPLAVSTGVLGGAFPGWSTTPLSVSHLDGLFASAWLLPVVLLGLAWPRSRPHALAALLYPAFFTAYALLLGRGVEAWYLLLPAALSVVAAAVVAEEALRRAAAGRPRPRLPGALPAAAFAVLLALPFAPAGAADALRPFASEPHGLAGTRAMAAGPGDLERALASLSQEDWGALFAVDVGWFHHAYPLAERAGVLGWAYTEHHGQVAAWVEALEVAANATLLRRTASPLNEAIRETYADCARGTHGEYVVLDAQACAGRGDALAASFQAHGGRPSP